MSDSRITHITRDTNIIGAKINKIYKMILSRSALIITTNKKILL